MSAAARSVFAFGLYLVGTAGILLLAPNVLLGVLGIAPTTEPWIRVLGMIVGVLSLYYLAAARGEIVPIMRVTIVGRVGACVGFALLAAVGWAPATLIGFGLVDAAGAFWTWRALRTAP